MKTFRKKLTWQKYDHVLNLFAEYAAPKSDARQISPEDIKGFLAWRKSKGCDPGTTLYTDRVILHNFFGRLKIDNPVKEVPKLPKFRKRPVAYGEDDLKRFFGVCDLWEKALFSVALATGLRRGELQTLEWPDLDLAHRRLHVRAKPHYAFLPKDWEERTVPLTKEVAALLKEHQQALLKKSQEESGQKCPLVFPSPFNSGCLSSPSYLHDVCKAVAKRAELDQAPGQCICCVHDLRRQTGHIRSL
jgi:integrase